MVYQGEYDRPDDQEWTHPSMLIRQAVIVAITCAGDDTEAIRQAVQRIDEWAETRGLSRHGRLIVESLDSALIGVASKFRIVNVVRFATESQKDGSRLERREISRWSWWRRLLWIAPPERKLRDGS